MIDKPFFCPCFISIKSINILFFILLLHKITLRKWHVVFLSYFSYVNTKGWHGYFKSYCIPEDLVPRILSPAYFHHYNAQIPSVPAGSEIGVSNKSIVKGESGIEKKKDIEGEQLVLGLGPVQNSFWRLSRLVPLEGVRRQINKYRGKQIDSTESYGSHSNAVEDEAIEPQSLEIQEGSDGISLKPMSDLGNKPSDITLVGKSTEKTQKDVDGRRWHRVPYLPSYVPFGQVNFCCLLILSTAESYS